MFARIRLSAFVCSLSAIAACSSSYSKPSAQTSKFTQVFVNVDAWNDTRADVFLVDGDGRKTGWSHGQYLRQIVGCSHGSTSEEGIPEGTELDSSGVDEVAPADSIPKYNYFDISNDIVTRDGLIDRGICELRLDPVVAGKIHLSITATGVGFSSCKDTTSVWVKAGVPSRWELTWKATNNGCAVRISKVGK